MKIGIFTIIPYWLNYKDFDLIEEEMKDFFQNKSYSDKVEDILIGVVCEPIPVNKAPARPWYYEDFKTNRTPTKETLHLCKFLDLRIRLDYDAYSKASISECRNIFARTLMNYLEEINYPLKIRKEFDKERFNRDMRKFLTERVGCKLE